MLENASTADRYCGGETWRIFYIEEDPHELFGDRRRHGSFRLCRDPQNSHTRPKEAGDIAVILRAGNYLKNNRGWPETVALTQGPGENVLKGKMTVKRPIGGDPETEEDIDLYMKLSIPTHQRTVRFDYGDAADEANAAHHGGRAHGEN